MPRNCACCSRHFPGVQRQPPGRHCADHPAPNAGLVARQAAVSMRQSYIYTFAYEGYYAPWLVKPVILSAPSSDLSTKDQFLKNKRRSGRTPILSIQRERTPGERRCKSVSYSAGLRHPINLQPQSLRHCGDTLWCHGLLARRPHHDTRG